MQKRLSLSITQKPQQQKKNSRLKKKKQRTTGLGLIKMSKNKSCRQVNPN